MRVGNERIKLLNGCTWHLKRTDGEELVIFCSGTTSALERCFSICSSCTTINVLFLNHQTFDNIQSHTRNIVQRFLFCYRGQKTHRQTHTKKLINYTGMYVQRLKAKAEDPKEREK